jgi:hypothetical protein
VITRRSALVSLMSLLAAPLAAEAQQARVYKIGYLSAAAGPTSPTQAFRQALQERGWVEGQNITIE